MLHLSLMAYSRHALSVRKTVLTFLVTRSLPFYHRTLRSLPFYHRTFRSLPFYHRTLRPSYLYRFSRDIPILALNHDFPISCGGVPIFEDAGIFRARRFRFVLFSPVFRRFLILSASCTYRQSRRCVAAIDSPPGAMSQC